MPRPAPFLKVLAAFLGLAAVGGLASAQAGGPAGGARASGTGDSNGEIGAGDRSLPSVPASHSHAKRTSVPRWSVYEIRMRAGRTYANPYADAGVTARFSGPGTTRTVRGFWDGRRSWKIRFACTAGGTWRYVTVSSDNDLDGKTGTVTCAAPRRGNHGFLRGDPANGRSFVWDDGTRYFMWGQTYYEIVRNAAAGTGWKTAIDRTAAYGMNKVRMLVYPWHDTAVSSRYPDSQPFTGPSAVPDHDSLNLAHWQRLDEIIRYLDSKGMVAELILYADADRVFGTEAQDARYTRYAVARLAAYHNVIWCLSNEWDLTGKNQAYWDAQGSIVRHEDPWMKNGSRLRPLSIHSSSDLTFNYPPSQHPWATHAVIQLHGKYTPNLGGAARAMTHPDEWGNEGIAANARLDMPVVNDEYGYIGDSQPVSSGALAYSRTRHRRVIWGIATAGGYGSAGDSRRLGSGETPWLTAAWRDEPGAYGDIRRLVDFFVRHGVRYWRMSSANSVTPNDRVYVLGQTGKEYVAYSAVGGSFTLRLPAGSAGSYRATWYEPSTGASIHGTGVTGGAARRFTPPFGGDAVLRLVSR